MRRKIIAGNWKMHGSKTSISQLLTQLNSGCLQITEIDWAIFPPYVYLEFVANSLRDSNILLGSQNVARHPDAGAYTGEISASMLKDCGCEYVIIGHSERRHLYGETNHDVAQKWECVIDVGLHPILCVGETEVQRKQGQTLEVVQEQLAVALKLTDNLSALASAIIAYEPVWAIGTGQQASPQQAQEIHQVLRNQVRELDVEVAEKIRIIYGGSVKANNVDQLFSMPDIDGALVGGASLQAEQFLAIGQQCNNSLSSFTS